MTQILNIESMTGEDPAVIAWREAFEAQQELPVASVQSIGHVLIEAA